MRIVGALAVPVAAVMLAAPAQAVTDQQIRFLSDVDQHGGITTEQAYVPGQTLGDAACADMKKGNVAANEVIGIANDVKSLNGSMSKAEVVVYWAITDLCPDFMSQRQDHWKDGN
jgi:hypothetical protein